MPTTKGVRNHGLFDALWRISECKDSNTPAEEILINEIRRSLPHFVQENPEYPSLLRFIADCLHTTELPDGLPIPDEQVHLNNKDTRYPAQVNDTLYTQLRMYSTCSCSTQHLEYARLRLDPEHGMQDDADIPFDLLFSAGAASCRTTNCHSRWKEAKVFVARYDDLRTSGNGEAS
ncbi:hypothetical protein N7509_013034 [Penicillium cosmopolitanum]|uniref:Uncharacterized protein n=1 Tax=Penicillium cosmopolitanum TaxID=1131564 RepID=A0A9W9VBM2_9EURO|nr:uncharacterized protein N7509_013034 [Penicillium cosmopolitanum]KAJ5376148.1 hypothetical protein N7509_013034 [Penicillium cosmopolitanum]